MKKTDFILSMLFLLPLAAGIGGCQGAQTSENAQVAGPADEYFEPTSLIHDENGGYDSDDEVPAFGLKSMGQYESDQQTTDPSVTSEEEDKLAADPDAQVYLIRIVWGNLELNARDEVAGEEGGDVIPWDGSLSYDGDATLLLKRTILFEANDSIADEADPKSIGWSSTTGPHVDGLLAKLIVVPGKSNDVFTFGTKSLTQDIPLAELDHFNEIVTLDEDGHGAAFTALRVDDDGDCAEGFLEGKWHPRREGEGGIFRGRVLSDEGELNGHVRGHYGERDGDQVFFGKYIHTDGLFRGFLNGTFGDGAFDGDWTAAGGELVGTLSGKYVTGEDVDSGFFQGFWQESCE